MGRFWTDGGRLWIRGCCAVGCIERKLYSAHAHATARDVLQFVWTYRG